MAGRQAKILTDRQIETLLAYAATTRDPLRNRVIVLLSMKAGLRANEIANLTWDMVVRPAGEIGQALELHNHAAKNKRGRRIPLRPDLQAALAVWQTQTSTAVGPVITSQRGAEMTAVSIVNWFAKAFRAAGLEGCSSHSGRRTFITRAARVAHRAGASLRDVQLLAGHRSIQTTQRYIDGDTEAQRKLVSLI
jgi:integrase/recombinase XerD